MKCFLLATLLLVQCSGELHFTKNKTTEPPPPPIPPTVPPITQRFSYLEPSGTLVLHFMFYRSRTMKPVIQRLSHPLGQFLNALLSTPILYTGIRLSVSIDDAGQSYPQWYFPSEQGISKEKWLFQSKQFLLQALSLAMNQLGKDHPGAIVPTHSFQWIHEQHVMQTHLPNAPLWHHFIYIRNRELFFDDSETLNRARENFLNTFTPFPLSRFQYSLHTISYQSGDTPCQPSPTKIGKHLNDIFIPYLSYSYELCRWGGHQMNQLVEDIHSFDRKIILAEPPDLESLTISIENQSVGKEHIIFDQQNNELTFASTLPMALNQGDSIEITYLPQTNP